MFLFEYEYKDEDFNYFLLRILPLQKIVLISILFVFEYECGLFFGCIV